MSVVLLTPPKPVDWTYSARAEIPDLVIEFARTYYIATAPDGTLGAQPRPTPPSAPPVAWDGHIYVYDPRRGVWVGESDEIMQIYVAELAKMQLVAKMSVDASGEVREKVWDPGTNEIVTTARAALARMITAADRMGFHAPSGPPVIGFTDGVLILTPGGLERRDHDPSYLLRTRYEFPVPDVSTARPRPRRFNQYLSDTFWDREAPDPTAEIAADRDRTVYLRRWIGRMLMGLGAGHGSRVLMLIGRAGTGKSTAVDIIKGLLPDVSEATNTDPTMWMADQYRVANIAGKKLAYCSDLALHSSRDRVIPTEVIKSAAYGEQIEIRKMRTAPETITPIAAHLWAANALPRTSDFGGALADRIAVIYLQRRLRGTGEEVVDMAGEILRAERAEIIADCLAAAAQQLVEDGYRPYRVPPIPFPKSMARLIDDARYESDPVAEFFARYSVPADHEIPLSERIQQSDALDAYNTWALANKKAKNALTSRTFGKRIDDCGIRRLKSNSGQTLMATWSKDAPLKKSIPDLDDLVG